MHAPALLLALVPLSVFAQDSLHSKIADIANDDSSLKISAQHSHRIALVLGLYFDGVDERVVLDWRER